MKSKAIILAGFVAGFAGFLLLFKVLILDRTTPEDELAPGAVLICAVISGVVVAYAARLLQRVFKTQ